MHKVYYKAERIWDALLLESSKINSCVKLRNENGELIGHLRWMLIFFLACKVADLLYIQMYFRSFQNFSKTTEISAFQILSDVGFWEEDLVQRSSDQF
jgi:hypothetical protein